MSDETPNTTGPSLTDTTLPQRVITVRMPYTLHDALTEEAHENRTSLNKLCIAKLLVPVDVEKLKPLMEKPKVGDALPEAVPAK